MQVVWRCSIMPRMYMDPQFSCVNTTGVFIMCNGRVFTTSSNIEIEALEQLSLLIIDVESFLTAIIEQNQFFLHFFKFLFCLFSPSQIIFISNPLLWYEVTVP